WGCEVATKPRPKAGEEGQAEEGSQVGWEQRAHGVCPLGSGAAEEGASLQLFCPRMAPRSSSLRVPHPLTERGFLCLGPIFFFLIPVQSLLSIRNEHWLLLCSSSSALTTVSVVLGVTTLQGLHLYLTRTKGNYTAVCLKDQSLTGLHQQLAKDFLNAHLYGPDANRAQANDFFSLENKKNPVKKAAVQFVDKSWGQEKKEKAARFKKRWLSTQIKN
uniref:U3 small nucleolar RNA-associated protein NOL7 C-terminal domain-containing protein n=1 Tax=Otus sunia TaxID=257818 RepID=A0A8C8BRV7_9STRI